MADWWESAPLAQADWWHAAPLATAAEKDKYQQAAQEQSASDKAAGISGASPYVTRILHGATLGASDEILAGLQTPIEMYRKGTLDPREGYKYAKASQDQQIDEARQATGKLGTAAEIGGGFLTGSNLARGGLTAARYLAPNSGLVARMGASAADAAGFGGVSGAMEGNSLGERAGNAGSGAAIGAGLGAALPLAGAIAGGAVSPIISNVRARLNPEGYAQSQLARALTESSQTPADVARNVGQAAGEGQGMFTVADALGNPGQRMLSGVTRSPGPGRTDAVEFLDQRQAGQARRLAQFLSEGFDSPQTAAQTRARLTDARDTAADASYGQVRNDAGPVDLTAAIRRLDETLTPGVNQIAAPRSGIANDSVESALQSFRGRLTDDRSMLTDFTAVQRVRGDLSDSIQTAERAGQGNKARLLRGVLREMDTAMENASAGHRAANQAFHEQSNTIGAVDEGGIASQRGRVEDTIPAFRAMPPQGQAAFRAGYVDPLIAQTQGAAFGVNKARPLTSEAFQQESAAFAPNAPVMNRQIERENTMFATRNHATGGSRTADNLADTQAQGIDPMVTSLLTGNLHGMARGALANVGNAMSGSTPEVRQHLARLLLTRGNARPLAHTLDDIIAQNERTRQLAIALGRGAMAGASRAPYER